MQAYILKGQYLENFIKHYTFISVHKQKKPTYLPNSQNMGRVIGNKLFFKYGLVMFFILKII